MVDDWVDECIDGSQGCQDVEDHVVVNRKLLLRKLKLELDNDV